MCGGSSEYIFETSVCTRSCSQIANAWPQGAVERLQVDRVDAPLTHAEAHIMQPWERRLNSIRRPVASADAGRKGPTQPEHLSGGSSPGPHNRVQVLRATLFCPEKTLAALDERLGLGVGDVCEGVVGICALPGLEGVAPGIAGREVADPGTGTTVEVEVVGGRLDDWEAGCRDVDGIVRGNPNDDKSVIGKSDIVGQDHFCEAKMRHISGEWDDALRTFPYDRRLASTRKSLVRLTNEGVENLVYCLAR